MNNRYGKKIGNGATSDVYEYDNDKVVKLYSEGCSIESVRWEYDKTLKAYENNLPVPKVYEIIEHNNRFGIVMEYIHGETLKNVIDKYIIKVVKEDISLSTFSEQVFELIKQTANYLFDIHKYKNNQIETMDDRMKRNVDENYFLTTDEKNKVIRIIESLPKGNSVCHGDPNPNNIMIDGKKIIFIDWVNAGTGNPLYDIAEYALLSTPTKGQLPIDTHPKLKEFYYKYKDLIVPTFLEEYEKISGLDITGYENWFIPLLTSKLNSNRTLEEKKLILDEIRRRLGCL